MISFIRVALLSFFLWTVQSVVYSAILTGSPPVMGAAIGAGFGYTFLRQSMRRFALGGVVIIFGVLGFLGGLAIHAANNTRGLSLGISALIGLAIGSGFVIVWAVIGIIAEGRRFFLPEEERRVESGNSGAGGKFGKE